MLNYKGHFSIKNHIKKILFFLLLTISISCNNNKIGQNAEVKDTIKDIETDYSFYDDKSDNFTKDTVETTKDGIVFQFVDEYPQFGNNDSDLNRYLQNNLTNPTKSKKVKKYGTVYVSFVVLTDGRISQTKILQGVAPEIDSECVRVIREMPKWKPGKKDGKIVNVKLRLPINFISDK